MKDTIKSNKYSPLYKPQQPFGMNYLYGIIHRVNAYIKPPEEKERVLDEIPKPDLEIPPAKDE